MNKQAFIQCITPMMHELGFRKCRNYWYREHGELVDCVNVQGSQWDKDDYYVEVGFSLANNTYQNPSLLKWLCRRRCTGLHGEKNIHPKELIEYIESEFPRVETQAQLYNYIQGINATKVCSQYWF